MNSLTFKMREMLGRRGFRALGALVVRESVYRALADRLDAQGMPALCNPLDLHVRDRRYAVSYGPVVYGEVRAIRGKAAGDRVAITIRQSVQRGRSSDETS